MRVQRQHGRQVPVGPDHDHAPVVAVDAAQFEDVLPRLKVSAGVPVRSGAPQTPAQSGSRWSGTISRLRSRAAGWTVSRGASAMLRRGRAGHRAFCAGQSSRFGAIHRRPGPAWSLSHYRASRVAPGSGGADGPLWCSPTPFQGRAFSSSDKCRLQARPRPGQWIGVARRAGCSGAARRVRPQLMAPIERMDWTNPDRFVRRQIYGAGGVELPATSPAGPGPASAWSIWAARASLDIVRWSS